MKLLLSALMLISASAFALDMEKILGDYRGFTETSNRCYVTISKVYVDYVRQPDVFGGYMINVSEDEDYKTIATIRREFSPMKNFAYLGDRANKFMTSEKLEVAIRNAGDNSVVKLNAHRSIEKISNMTLEFEDGKLDRLTAKEIDRDIQFGTDKTKIDCKWLRVDE